MINSLGSLFGGSQTSSIENLISQYMALERRPVEILEAQKDELNVRSTMFSELKTKISDLKTLAEELAGIDDDAITTPTTVFQSHTVTSSDSDLATASASTSAADGTYLLENIVLAKAHRAQSALLSNSWTAGSDGTIAINGTQISITSGDTLDDVRNAINSASYATGRGVVATIINVDGSNSRLVLDAQNTGTDYKIEMADLAGSTLSSLGLATTSSSSVAISSATASSEDVGYPATNLIDGLTGDTNSWHGGSGETSWTVNLDLGSAQTVNRLVWGRDQGGTATGGTPQDYTIEYLDDDGVTWHTLKSVTDNSLEAGASKTDTFYSVNTSQLRITVTATNDDTPPAIDEIALYNDVGTLSQTELQAATDASLTINGVSVTGKSSNTLIDTVSGLTITLKEAGGPVTLTVSPDTSSMRSKIDSFLTKVNDLVDYIRNKSEVTKGVDDNYSRGLLSGYTLYTRLHADLAGDILSVVTGGSEGTPNLLSDLGVTMDDNMHFIVSDSTKLNDLLSTSASKVAEFFGASDGIGRLISDRLSPYVEAPSSSVDSYLERELQGISDQQASIDERIGSLNERLAIREQNLRSQFTRLQAMLIEATQMQQRMQSIFSYTSGWGF